MTNPDRARLLAQADSIIKQHNFTREDSSRIDSILRLCDSLTPPITKAELQAAKVANFERSFNPPPVLDTRADYDALFDRYLHSGSKQLAQELRTVSYTAQTSVTDATGAVLVPKGFEVALETALRAYDPIFDAARLVETTTGAAFNYPVSCDETNEAEIVAENAEGRNIPVAWNGIAFAACPKWSSGFVLFPLELQQDSAFDLSSVLVQLFARRFAAGIGHSFITTLLSEAASSATSAAAGVVTADEIIDLYGSVDAAYLPTAGWLMSSGTHANILKLKNTNSSFYFPTSVDSAGNPLLLGKRVFLSPSMPSLSASNKAVAFGDMNMFIRRQVRNSLTVHVMNEMYIEKAQIAAGATWRMHGHLVTSSNPSDSSPAMRVITQHS